MEVDARAQDQAVLQQDVSVALAVILLLAKLLQVVDDFLAPELDISGPHELDELIAEEVAADAF